jgi:hypothetical protein
LLGVVMDAASDGVRAMESLAGRCYGSGPMGRHFIAIVGPFLALVVGACGTASETTAVDAGPVAAPELQLGTGKDSFEPLAEGQTVELIHGPQGGWHIWGSLRARGLASPLTVVYAVALADTGEVLSSTTYEIEPLAAGSWSLWAGLIGYVPEPERVAKQPVALSMQVTDARGVQLGATQRVVAGDLPNCPTEPMPGNPCSASP